jgi:hypothetical protein
VRVVAPDRWCYRGDGSVGVVGLEWAKAVEHALVWGGVVGQKVGAVVQRIWGWNGVLDVGMR